MTTRAATGLVLLLVAVGWPLLPPFTATLLSYVGLYAIVAVGLVMLTGIGGMTSFGQAAFVGLGAYATAWICTAEAAQQALAMVPAAWLPWVGLLFGLLATLAVAWVLGMITLPLSGHYLALATLAWGISLYYVFGNLALLGGFTGIPAIPALTLGTLELKSPGLYGALVWGLLLLIVWALHNLLGSSQGRALRALRGNRIMAESVGVPSSRERMKLFLLAALLAALSGWLYAHFQRFVNPTPFNLNMSIEYLFMVVVGGAGYLWGGVLGALLITLLKQQLQDVLPQLLGASGNFELVVFGLLMLFVMQRTPQGIWAAVTGISSRWLRVPLRPSPAGDGIIPLARRAMPAAGQVVLRAERLSRHFSGLAANDQIDLEVAAGEIHALIGPNGAGKSTFFNLVSGVDRASSGRITLLGRGMSGQPPHAFAAAGLARTFQHVRLMSERSVLENAALGAYLRGARGWLAAMLRLERKRELSLLREAQQQLDRCGLSQYAMHPAGALPLGQQRLVEIARALAADPLALLLDEPAAGLRTLEKQALAALLRQLRAGGLAILLVEHDMSFVMDLADRVTVLEAGRVIASGPPARVQADPLVLQAYLGSVTDIPGNAA